MSGRRGMAGRGWVSPDDVPLRRSFVDHLTEIALTSEEIINDCESTLSGNDGKHCRWTRIMNPDGVCYTFNMIDSKELFNDNV